MPKPIRPAMPAALELLPIYPCPACHKGVPVVTPVTPTEVSCQHCGFRFPIVPLDVQNVQFIRLMSSNGLSMIDQDFL